MKQEMIQNILIALMFLGLIGAGFEVYTMDRQVTDIAAKVTRIRELMPPEKTITSPTEPVPVSTGY
jgi:hypothetical protein